MGYGAENGPDPAWAKVKPWIRLTDPQPIWGLCRSCGSSRRGSTRFESNTFPAGEYHLYGWECDACDTFGYDVLEPS